MGKVIVEHVRLLPVLPIAAGFIAFLAYLAGLDFHDAFMAAIIVGGVVLVASFLGSWYAGVRENERLDREQRELAEAQASTTATDELPDDVLEALTAQFAALNAGRPAEAEAAAAEFRERLKKHQTERSRAQ